MIKKSASAVLKEAQTYVSRGEWEKVDSEIVPAIKRYSSKDVARSLYPLFISDNPDVRDLAGTLAATLNVSNIPKRDRSRLRNLLQRTMKDEHPYASFRATLAALELDIYEPHDTPVMKKVLNNIIKTEKDMTLRKMAATALQKLKKA